MRWEHLFDSWFRELYMSEKPLVPPLQTLRPFNPPFEYVDRPIYFIIDAHNAAESSWEDPLWDGYLGMVSPEIALEGEMIVYDLADVGLTLEMFENHAPPAQAEWLAEIGYTAEITSYHETGEDFASVADTVVDSMMAVAEEVIENPYKWLDGYRVSPQKWRALQGAYHR